MFEFLTWLARAIAQEIVYTHDGSITLHGEFYTDMAYTYHGDWPYVSMPDGRQLFL